MRRSLLMVTECSTHRPSRRLDRSVMLAYIVTDVHFNELAVFGQFTEKVFVEVVELVLKIVVGEFVFCIEVAWILIYIADEDGLRKGGTSVLA